MSLWAPAALTIGSIVADWLFGGGESGNYTDAQKRMFGIQADIAEMMKGLMQSRIANEEQYMGPTLQAAMNLGSQRLQPARSTLWAPGVFTPKYASPQGVDMQLPDPGSMSSFDPSHPREEGLRRRSLTTSRSRTRSSRGRRM